MLTTFRRYLAIPVKSELIDDRYVELLFLQDSPVQIITANTISLC